MELYKESLSIEALRFEEGTRSGVDGGLCLSRVVRHICYLEEVKLLLANLEDLLAEVPAEVPRAHGHGVRADVSVDHGVHCEVDLDQFRKVDCRPSNTLPVEEGIVVGGYFEKDGEDALSSIA